MLLCLLVSSTYYYRYIALLTRLRATAFTKVSDNKSSELSMEDENENIHDISEKKLVFRLFMGMI